MKMHRASQDNYYSQEFLDSNDPLNYLNQSFSFTDLLNQKIRKLTPLEALMLQGFDEKFYLNCKESGISNNQIYKQAGNAVSVNPVYAFLDYLIFNQLITN